MAAISINDDNHPNNGGKFLAGDMVEYCPAWSEYDIPGYIVIVDEDSDGYFEIVNSYDDIVEVSRDDVSFYARY